MTQPIYLNGESFLKQVYTENDSVFQIKTKNPDLFDQYQLQEIELVLSIYRDEKYSYYLIKQPLGNITEYANIVDYLERFTLHYIKIGTLTSILQESDDKSINQAELVKNHIIRTKTRYRPAFGHPFEVSNKTLETKYIKHLMVMQKHKYTSVFKQEPTEEQEIKQPVFDFKYFNTLSKEPIMYLIYPLKNKQTVEELAKNLKITTDADMVKEYATQLIGVTGKVQVAKVVREFRAPTTFELGEYEINEHGEYTQV